MIKYYKITGVLRDRGAVFDYYSADKEESVIHQFYFEHKTLDRILNITECEKELFEQRQLVRAETKKQLDRERGWNNVLRKLKDSEILDEP